MTARIEYTVTSGTFSLDGQTHHVDNNVWILGDSHECVIIDAPHDIDAILHLVGNRHVRAILATHAHDDHVRIAPELADRVQAPIWLHPDDLVLWNMTHPHRQPDHHLTDGQTIDIAGTTLHVLHTPGHAPGAVCFHAPDLPAVFTGDTLFAGGPGATGRSYSNHDVILESITTQLLTLPTNTTVHPGHGPTTTIGDEKPHIHAEKPRD